MTNNVTTPTAIPPIAPVDSPGLGAGLLLSCGSFGSIVPVGVLETLLLILFVDVLMSALVSECVVLEEIIESSAIIFVDVIRDSAVLVDVVKTDSLVLVDVLRGDSVGCRDEVDSGSDVLSASALVVIGWSLELFVG